MGLIIEDEILKIAKMTEEELRQEIALLLFQRGKLTLAQAARFARMDRLRFQHLLASREVPVHYDQEGWEKDLKALEELNAS